MRVKMLPDTFLYQKNIQALMEQLQEDYSLRDQLWVSFNKSFNELGNLSWILLFCWSGCSILFCLDQVEPVLETLKATPAKVERTIAYIEKHSKTLDKDTNETLTEKKLKDLLNKIKWNNATTLFLILLPAHHYALAPLCSISSGSLFRLRFVLLWSTFF